MKILIDINVILDVLQKRLPFFNDASKIVNLCINGDVQGYLTSQSIPTIWYLLKKDYSNIELRNLLLALLNIFDIISLDKKMCIEALTRKNFTDFEDCLQDECATYENLDFIITRNKKDYKFSKITALTAEEFLLSL